MALQEHQTQAAPHSCSTQEGWAVAVSSGPPSHLALAVDAVAEAGAAPGTAAAGLERPGAGNLHPPLPHGPALPCLRGGRGEGAAQAGQGMRHTRHPRVHTALLIKG